MAGSKILAAPDRRDELCKLIETELLPIVRNQAGFIGVRRVALSDEPRAIVFLSLWRCAEDIENFERAAPKGIKTLIAPMLDSELKTRMFEVAGPEAEALLISMLSCERGRLNGWPE